MPQCNGNDSNAYCYLKQKLEPRFQVVAEPSTDYFSEWRYCYRVLDGNQPVHELRGDFRDFRPGEVIDAARRIVANLIGEATVPNVRIHQATAEDARLPIASRLPPKRAESTYFSSGRAAFVWLLSQVIRPKRVYLPTFVAGSLISAMQSRLPDTDLSFYSVDRDLDCHFPDEVDDQSALVLIHYFGHFHAAPVPIDGMTLLDDMSHLPLSLSAGVGDYTFGSLRKVYRTADGGFARGQFNPVYEARKEGDAWLRLQATDWRDMREAENMTDRDWSIADISSQSLAVVMNADCAAMQRHRHACERHLRDHLGVGRPLLRYEENDFPLMHNRLLESRQERDSLRAFLASRGVYCSIHWQTHPYLLKRQDSIDITEALWLQDQILSIPLCDHFGERELETICRACDDWRGN